MDFRRFFVVSALAGSLIAIKTASCYTAGQTPDLASLSDADLKTVTISLERGACYGSCPVYTVTIHGDGRVTYAGKAYVKVKEAKDGHVDVATIRALMGEFARAKFLSLPEDYSLEKCACRQCTDMASAITELSVRGVTHRVHHDFGCGCAPKALFELEHAIDKAVQVEQWTGDVSEQGPFATTCFGPAKPSKQ